MFWQIPNHVLYNRKVGNWTVSGPQTDHFFLSIPWKTPLEKIQGLEKVFKDFLQANSDTMQPDTSFMFVRELVEQNRLLVYFYMQHTDNFRNWIHLPKRQALLLLLKVFSGGRGWGWGGGVVLCVHVAYRVWISPGFLDRRTARRRI